MSGLINDPNLSLLVKFDVIANDVITEHVKPGSTVMEETPADQIEVKVDQSNTTVDSNSFQYKQVSNNQSSEPHSIWLKQGECVEMFCIKKIS